MSRPDAAVVLDFDGTLIPKSGGALMRLVADALGDEARPHVLSVRGRYAPMFESGHLEESDYREWVLEEMRSYVRFRLVRGTWRTALDAVRLRPGVLELLRGLRAAGIPVAVVSAAVADFAEHVLERNGVLPFVDALHAARLTHGDCGTVHGWCEETLVTPGGKGRWSRAFADRHGVPHDALVAVGDSPGDAQLGHLRENRLAVAETEEEAERLRALGFASEVLVVHDFVPAADWVRRRLGLPH